MDLSKGRLCFHLLSLSADAAIGDSWMYQRAGYAFTFSAYQQMQLVVSAVLPLWLEHQP